METKLIWPDKPLAHVNDWQAERYAQLHSTFEYRQPRPDGRDADDPYGYPFRSCGYCGSINPEDLFNLLKTTPGVTLGGSDWKYGWPHKFYVENIPNPKVGKRVSISSMYCGDMTREQAQAEAEQRGLEYELTENKGRFEIKWFEPAHAITPHAKWYNVHIKDITDKETRDAFCILLAERSGIWFRLEENGDLRYSAPYAGYQR